MTHDAVRQNIDALCDAAGQSRILLDEEYSEAGLAQLAQGTADLPDDDWRKTERRFVEYEELRIRHQPQGDREHLLLSTRQRARGLHATLGQDGEKRKAALDIHGHLFGALEHIAARSEAFLHRPSRETPTGPHTQ